MAELRWHVACWISQTQVLHNNNSRVLIRNWHSNTFATPQQVGSSASRSSRVRQHWASCRAYDRQPPAALWEEGINWSKEIGCRTSLTLACCTNHDSHREAQQAIGKGHNTQIACTNSCWMGGVKIHRCACWEGSPQHRVWVGLAGSLSRRIRRGCGPGA
jgi:hypothetical protein